MVPSPKVATYDTMPEMAAEELTQKLLDRLAIDVYSFFLINFANPDMVGHTGNIKAAIRACEVTDATSEQARRLGIALKNIDDVDAIDLTVDGADEVDLALNGIKGGGAALLMEKIVATYSRDYIWIVDDAKMVTHLGAFPLPVEVEIGRAHV